MKQRFVTARRYANYLRQVPSLFSALVHVRRESGKCLSGKSLEETTLQALWMRHKTEELEPDLPSVLPEPSAFMYRLRFALERLTDGGLEELNRSGPITDEQEEWLYDLGQELTSLAAVLDSAIKSSGTPERKPLTEAAHLVYVHLCSLPESVALTEADLVTFLASRKVTATDNRIRKGIRAELLPYGLQNLRGAGYYIPLADRPAELPVDPRRST